MEPADNLNTNVQQNVDQMPDFVEDQSNPQPKQQRNKYLQMLKTKFDIIKSNLKNLAANPPPMENVLSTIKSNQTTGIQAVSVFFFLLLILNFGLYVFHGLAFLYLMYVSLSSSIKNTYTASEIVSFWIAYGTFVCTEPFIDYMILFVGGFSLVYYLVKLFFVCWLITNKTHLVKFSYAISQLYINNATSIEPVIDTVQKQSNVLLAKLNQVVCVVEKVVANGVEFLSNMIGKLD